jgi:hypothetical protein
MRPVVRPALVALLLAGCGSPPVAQKPRVAPKRRAVAAVVVDQLGAWILEMHAAGWAHAKPGDPTCHGFCRLMREGTYYPRMEYAHAITDTAPGHATLFTGVPPRTHGIGQNEKALPDPTRASGTRAIGVMVDERERLVSPAGPTELSGPSLSELRVNTVADDLRSAVPDACIVSVSLKDRAALFGGGRKPTLTAFYEPALRGFVTSTAFARRLAPEAVLTYAPGELEKRLWLPRNEPWLRAQAPTADDQPGEGDYHGLGSVFPHPLAGKPGAATPNPGAAYRMTPFGDEDVRAVGKRSLALCKDKPTTFVALSFSSHDYVTHTFGAHSWEAWDEFDRLDRTLETWLADLDAEYGADGWSLVLAADHGSMPLPELAVEKRPWCAAGAPNPWDLPCAAGVRLASGAIFRQLEERAERELGPGPWIGAVTDPRIVLSARGRQLAPDQRARLRTALEAELMATGGVETVIDLAAPMAACGAEPLGADVADLIRRTVCFSQPEVRGDGPAGDLYVVVKKGSFFDAGYVLGKGVSHGSPWLYDRAVPLLVREGGGGARNVVRSEPISYRTFAHTLRQWLGVAKSGN